MSGFWIFLKALTQFIKPSVYPWPVSACLLAEWQSKWMLGETNHSSVPSSAQTMFVLARSSAWRHWLSKVCITDICWVGSRVMIKGFDTTCSLQSLQLPDTENKRSRHPAPPSPLDLWHLDCDRICEVKLVCGRVTLPPLTSQIYSVKSLMCVKLLLVSYRN